MTTPNQSIDHLLRFEHGRHKQKIANRLTHIGPQEIGVNLLISLNMMTFVGVGLAGYGMSFSAVQGFITLSFTTILVLGFVEWKVLKDSHAGLILRSLCGQLPDDLLLGSIILFNLGYEQQAPASVVIISICIMSFVSLIKRIRFFSVFVGGKIFLIGACIAYSYLSTENIESQTTQIFPLIIFMLFICTLGYWLRLGRIRQYHQHFEQEELQTTIHKKNQQLSITLQSEQQARIALDKEYLLREKIMRHVGHDLRQPFSALAYAIYALDKTSLNTDQTANIETAERCLQSAGNLIEEILRLSVDQKTPQHKIPEPCPLSDLFTALESEYQYQITTANIRMRFRRSSLIIDQDYNLVKRILSNFISNALKHAPGSPILVGVRRRESSIDIQVIDQGPGISETLQEDIFTEYVHSEPPLSTSIETRSYGLGLNIVQRLAKECGAQIQINSEPGRGTLCALIIPFSST